MGGSLQPVRSCCGLDQGRIVDLIEIGPPQQGEQVLIGAVLRQPLVQVQALGMPDQTHQRAFGERIAAARVIDEGAEVGTTRTRYRPR